MNAFTLNTRTGRWAVGRLTPDPYRYIRDRELVDLIDALEAAAEIVTDVDVDGGKLSAHEGEQINNALDAAARYLRELRARQIDVL
jgi:hypothetical protein